MLDLGIIGIIILNFSWILLIILCTTVDIEQAASHAESKKLKELIKIASNYWSMKISALLDQQIGTDAKNNELKEILKADCTNQTS